MTLRSAWRSATALLMALIVLALMAMTGCSPKAPDNKAAPGTATQSSTAPGGTLKLQAKAQSASTLGDSAKDGVSLELRANALDADGQISINKLTQAESSRMQSTDFQILGSPVKVQVDTRATIRLNQPATITLTFAPQASLKNPDDIYAGYHNGKAWEYFLPDKVDLAKGTVQFTTWHFSLFGVGKLSEKEQIERFAGRMAVNTWARKRNQQQFVEATGGYFDEAFAKLGIKDSEARGRLIRSIAKEYDYGELMVSLERNDALAFGTKVTEMASKAVLDRMRLDTDFAPNALGIASTAAKAAGRLAGGDYEGAQKEIASGMMDLFPAGRALKVAIEVIDTGINDWKDNEIEVAYQAYKNGAVKERGYDVTKGNWSELAAQMKGIMHKVYSDAIRDYCDRNGVKEASLSKSTLDKIRSDAEAKLKKRFEKRLASEHEIQAEKANHAKIVATFKRLNLLERGSFGFEHGANIEDRLYRLYNVMDNIREVIGHDIPIEDMCVLIGAWYNDRTPRKTAFYARLKEMGYPKAAAKSTPPPAAQKPSTPPTAPANAEYAWVLKSVVDYNGKDAEAAANKSKSYSYATTYSQGAFSIKTTYMGATDTYYKPPVVRGESLTVRANWSKPPQVIRKDQTVTLDLQLAVAANSQSFFTFKGSATAYFDAESIGPGSATRAAIALVNGAKQSSFETNKGNNYKTFNEKVSAKPRTGTKPGDRMALLVTFYSSYSIGTKYIYEWSEVK